jgi:leucyl aminopeptidase
MAVITDKKAFQKAVPILVSDRTRLPKLLAQLTPVERRWAEASEFDASAQSFAIVPDAKGGIAKVLAGVRDATDPWALAALPMKLPRGSYALGKGSVAIAPEHAAFSWELGGYKYARYRKSVRKPAVLQIEAGARVKEALEMAEAVRLVRDLVNTPAEDLGPQELSDVAREQADLFGGEFDEWVGDELLAQNFPAIHAVGRASAKPPRLIEINWGNPKHPRLAVVGKGVCFDTGGLDLKPAAGMLQMKKDMGGAAVVLGLASALMAAKTPIRLRVLIPAVENSVSANAIRPLDIVRTRSGKTVEIGNADAEGRLILCDALAEADSENPNMLIDCATLTGAARVALGPEVQALFCNDDALADAILRASVDVADPVWRMPLWKPYRRMIDSKIADFNNVADGPYAGSIIGALYLAEFVRESTPWAHLDIMASNTRARPGRPEGGEATGLRALYRMIRQRFG